MTDSGVERPKLRRGGGYLHIVPTYVPENLTATAMSVAMHPWLTPAHSGMLGTAHDGQPALSVTFEAPTIWLRTTEPLSKSDREWLYLRRYSADQALATGSHAFAAVRPGADPPDALATTDAGVLGVESTSLTLQDRRGAHALFRTLRQRLLREEPAHFGKLGGHMIYVWFGHPAASALTLPPRRSEAEAVDALVAALADYAPDTDRLFVDGGELPDPAPALPLAAADGGATFYAVPLANAVPSSMLFTVAGFELGLAFSSFVTAQSGWAELGRLVASHDKPGVELLLISVGAPDANGYTYPSEEAFSDFLVQHPCELPAPQHIGRVVLHWWSSGRAVSLYPDFSPLFGPLYAGLVPVHHVLPPR